MINIVLNQQKNFGTLKKKKNAYCLVCKKKTDNKTFREVPLVKKTVTQR